MPGPQRDINELELAGVKIKQVPAYQGKLGPFIFRRSHSYYWIVNGPMPLYVAKLLHADPCGKRDVRVSGHCGCPPPEDPWISWLLPDGRQVAPTHTHDGQDQQELWLKFIENGALHRDQYDRHVFHNDPLSIGAVGYIDTYHVDSLVGLKLIVDTIKRYGLDKTEEPVGWEDLL